jgi:hypothetical protein
MADQEVIKHTKKLYKILGTSKRDFWEKVKELIIEIIIIFFAVSLSIWLHERSAHTHQQQDVKAFLVGLKEDLKSDIREMTEDKKSYEQNQVVFGYIARLKPTLAPSDDSLRRYMHSFYNATLLLPNNGRFEGFKASGKIGTIENNALQNEVMDLYTEDIPSLLSSTNNYNDQKSRFADLLHRNVENITDSTNNLAKVVRSPEAINRSITLSEVREIFDRYDACIARSKRIINLINKEYDLDDGQAHK